jgi:hypothetical protein
VVTAPSEKKSFLKPGCTGGLNTAMFIARIQICHIYASDNYHYFFDKIVILKYAARYRRNYISAVTSIDKVPASK